MKKIALLTLFAVFSLVANAQNDGKYDYFIEVISLEMGNNYIPTVSFEEYEEENLYDENGNKLKFKSRSAVINYFTKMGWSFVQEISYRLSKSFTHFLFKKQVKDYQEAKQGLIFKEDIKK